MEHCIEQIETDGRKACMLTSDRNSGQILRNAHVMKPEGLSQRKVWRVTPVAT